MSNTALAVGVSISGAFVLMIVGVVILICVLNKQSPSRRRGILKNTTNVRSVKKGTVKIKRKAEILKADKARTQCCAFMACCKGGRSAGPFPDPPFGVELQEPSSSEVTIIWNAPEAENQPVTLLGYNIYKRFEKSPDDWTKVGKVTVEELEFRIRDLVPNKRYVFGVSSRAKTGESTIVESQPTVLKKDPVRPGAPADLDVTSKTSSSVTLSWKPPRKIGYSRIHTYYLLMKDCEGNADWTYVTTLTAFDSFMDYKVTGLKPRHPYRFRVSAENVAGQGPYAETVTIETADPEPDPPEKPKGPVKYSKISHNSITLSWQQPEKDGGKPVSGFAVEYKEKDSKRWTKADVCEADTTQLTVSRLHEDIEYIFRVIAINIVGNSKPLVGGKVRTKLLEIPLSRRSSFRLSSRAENSRGSSRGKHSATESLGKDTGRALADLESNTLPNNVEGFDQQLDADPFVPKSDFFSYDETNSGSISNRHSENKTKHSQFSPLPAPPPSQSKKRSGPAKHRHSDLSPLPKPQSHQYTNGRVRKSHDSYDESDYDENENEYNHYGNSYNKNRSEDYDGSGTHQSKMSKDSEITSQTNTQSSILTELPDFKRPGGHVRHQPTPSNTAYTHSRF